MKHGSLFSGGGGFDLAAEAMGWQNAFHCEKDPFCQSVLNFYWPNAIHFDDIGSLDGKKFKGKIDTITGGFPCQPFSSAGQRRGVSDDRYLWPEMLRVIREASPRWVVAENVYGLINWNEGLVFDTVQSDLESEGYEVGAYVLPAAGVNAPHQRYRVWIVGFKPTIARKGKKQTYPNSNGIGRRSTGIRFSTKEKRNARKSNQVDCVHCTQLEAPGSDPNRNGLLRQNCKNEKYPSQSRKYAQCNPQPVGSYAPNPCGKGLQRRTKAHNTKREGAYPLKHIAGLRKLPDWNEWPTQSPLCGGDDGLPIKLDGITVSKWRTQSIKMFGNAIVPQVAIQIFQAIEDYETSLMKEYS